MHVVAKAHDGRLHEETHRVVKLRQWLPAGPLAAGGQRERTLVQFFSAKGGMRTVAVDDVVLL